VLRTKPAPGPRVLRKRRATTIAPELIDEQVVGGESEKLRQKPDCGGEKLALAQGKDAGFAQQDLVSKIRGFVDSAREAMKQKRLEALARKPRKPKSSRRNLPLNP